MKDQSFFCFLRITNPSAFNQAGGHGIPQLTKQLGDKLFAFKSQRDWAYQLTEDVIAQSIRQLTNSMVDVPYYRNDSESGEVVPTGITRRCEHLRLEPKAIIIASLKSNVLEEQGRTTQMKASLPTALLNVLGHQYCSTKRDFIYGAPRQGTPHVLEVLSVTGESGERELLVQNARKEKEPLTEDIDDFFIRQFNAKVNVGKYVQRMYPSNHPVELMQQLFYFHLPHEVRPPYPMHDPLYFSEEYRRLQTLHMFRVSNQKLRLLDSVDQDSDTAATRERALENEVFARACRDATVMQQVQQLQPKRKGLTPQMVSLMEGKWDEDSLEETAATWLHENHSKPIHSYLVRLSTPHKLDNDRAAKERRIERHNQDSRRKQKLPRYPDHWPLPEGTQHPLTTLRVMVGDDSEFMQLYQKTVKTQSDVGIDFHRATLLIDETLYRVRSSALQLESAQDPGNRVVLSGLSIGSSWPSRQPAIGSLVILTSRSVCIAW